MLKRKDDPKSEPESLAGLFGRAKDQARAWVLAEVALYRTIGTEKAKAWQVPAILFATALFLAHAAALVLVATLFVGLARLMNPVLAGLLTTVLLGALAVIAVKIGFSKLKEPKA